ncbi:hypothetical protein [Modestobacter sp. NPDC049651]|uniref:SCO7613 C-terminal domain-containing membrane protein n=1 Tax=unclassified Modestobacter TaxID=2643866 RepID=UPI00340683F5
MARRSEVVYPPPLAAAPPPPPAAESDGVGRLSPQLVLVGAGAVAVVAAGGASVAGASAGQVLLTLLVVALAAGSVTAGHRELRTSEETLAAACAVLAAIGAEATSRSSAESPVLLLALLSAAFLAVSGLARGAATWPIAAWCAGQLAVLSALGGLELAPAEHVAALLGTASAGVAVALRARRPVALVALATSLPWWGVGVVEGARLAWRVDGVTAGTAAALMTAGAAGLLALRTRRELHRWLGPRPAVPVVAGAVAGTGLAGALQAIGPAGEAATGWLGLAVAAAVGAAASPGPRSLLRPAGLSLATTLTLLAVVQLLRDGHWTVLAVQLAVAAVPAVLVAARQPADRAGALPIAVGCLAASVALAEADGQLPAAAAGPLLLLIGTAALAGAAVLRGNRSERSLAVAGTVVGIAAVVHQRLAPDDPSSPVLGLAVLGAALLGYGALTDRSRARALGCAALVLAAWVAAADAGLRVPEAYTLPAAIMLLLYPARGLADGPSWPTWGPGLLVGFLPSGWLAVTEPDLVRLVGVLLAAVAAVAAGTLLEVRAPFAVGAGVLVGVAVGRVLVSLPPAGQLALLVVGVALIAAGTGYEDARRSAVRLAAHVADLR